MTSIADADDVHHLALALPDVAEIEGDDGFDFRGCRQGIRWPHPVRRPGQIRSRARRARGLLHHGRLLRFAAGDASAEQVDFERVGEP